MALIANFDACAFASETYDDLTIDQMAHRMGINRKVLKKQIEHRRDLSLKAWKAKKKPFEQTSQAFHRYEEVFRHEGKQVFYNDWHDVYAVFGLKGGMKDVKTLDEAIQLVYED